MSVNFGNAVDGQADLVQDGARAGRSSKQLHIDINSLTVMPSETTRRQRSQDLVVDMRESQHGISGSHTTTTKKQITVKYHKLKLEHAKYPIRSQGRNALESRCWQALTLAFINSLSGSHSATHRKGVGHMICELFRYDAFVRAIVSRASGELDT